MAVEIVTKKDLEILENKIISEIKQIAKGNNSKYVTKKEALKILGCADTTLSNLKKDRKIEFVKIGDETQFLRTSLFEHLKNKSIKVIK